MVQGVSAEFALEVLLEDAERIKRLIRNQKNSLCISQCKAFEEVVDTQMYGLSRQVAFAVRLGIVTNEVGHQLLSDLEKDLNLLYSEVYENQHQNIVGKEA
ncbi:MAG: YlaN family protein [Enterococcus sp.]